MSDFVTVATFNYIHETVIIRARLDSEGILSRVSNEISMGLQPFFSPLNGGVRLEVNPEDAEEATRILKEAGYLDSQ